MVAINAITVAQNATYVIWVQIVVPLKGRNSGIAGSMKIVVYANQTNRLKNPAKRGACHLPD